MGEHSGSGSYVGIREHQQVLGENHKLRSQLAKAVDESQVLRRENERLRTYALEVGAILLEETDSYSVNDLETVEAANVLAKKLIEDPTDSFVVHELTLFTEEDGHKPKPEVYDLIVQKAGAETFHDNLEACKADNARLRAELEEKRKDTERHDYWFSNDRPPHEIVLLAGKWVLHYADKLKEPQVFDSSRAAIDAAMTERGGRCRF